MIYLKKYALSLALSITILVLCLMDTADLPESPATNFDKLVHWLMFLALSGTVFFETTAYLKKRIPFRWMFWGAFVFPLLFGGAIEIMQEYLSPCRTGDWMDFLYDGIGAFTGILIGWGINRRLKKQ